MTINKHRLECMLQYVVETVLNYTIDQLFFLKKFKPGMPLNVGNARQGRQQWSRTKGTSSRRYLFCFMCQMSWLIAFGLADFFLGTG